jgi:DnaJ like chaperone protein
MLCERLYILTKNDYERRLTYLDYLLNLAFIDGDFSRTEREITEDIAQALKIENKDYAQLISKLEAFHINMKEQDELSLEKAYTILNSSSSDDDNTIKKKYRGSQENQSCLP